VTPAVEVSSRPMGRAPCAWPAHARRTAALDDLVDIYEPALTLVTAPVDVAASGVEALTRAASEVPCFEFVKETSGEGEALEYAMPWFEGHAGGRAWLELAQSVVRLFADLFEAERLGVRLTLSDKPMCPRFHVDDVVCRLVVTLVGRGSEFLGEPDVRRKLLGAKESPVEREGATIHHLAPLEVGLFKGEAWPDNKGRGIVHRSPAGSDRRLVMTVDLL
jgi:hypothetical protein